MTEHNEYLNKAKQYGIWNNTTLEMFLNRQDIPDTFEQKTTLVVHN